MIAVALCLVSLIPAQAQERLTVRIKAGEDRVQEAARALTINSIPLAFCRLESSTGPSRPIRPDPSAPARLADPVTSPLPCPYQAPYDRSRYYFGFGTQSVNDVGTWQVICESRVSAAPIRLADGSIGHPVDYIEYSSGACGSPYRVVIPFFGTNQTFLADRIVTFEVFNDPPVVSLTELTSSLLGDRTYPYDGRVEIRVGASDPDGGTPRIEWRLTGPGVSDSGTGDVMSRQFASERDFGTWTFTARAIDDEYEYAEASETITVVNQTPAPTISGPSRVPFGMPVALEVTPDEDGGDYTSVTWEALPPSGGAITVPSIPGDLRRIEMPTEIGLVGTWTFRATVTDNESPALTGTSNDHVVEIYNEPPVITLSDVTSSVAADGGLISIDASANDPDGGPVSLRVEAAQTPDRSGIAPGSVLARGTDRIEFRQLVAPDDAGSWVFRIVAEDDEPVAARATAQEERIVLVDAPPFADIEAELQVSSLDPIRLDGSASFDPDSRCESGPACGHSTDDGSSPRGLTDGITRYRWDLVSATPDDPEAAVDTGALSELFGTAWSAAVVAIDPGSLPGGHYLFRLTVTDAEGNQDSTDHGLQVIAPNSSPVAIATPPQRVPLTVLGSAGGPVAVSGRASFDPDNVLTGDLPGIADYEWTRLSGPGGCLSPHLGGEADWPLFPGGIVPGPCQGLYVLGLTVTDHDVPPLRGDTFTSLIFGTCDTLVCIDLPTASLPARVAFAEDTDILILYHVDPLAMASPSGLHTRLSIFHDSDPLTPVFRSQVSNRVTGGLSPLLVFHWDGYWGPLRPRPGRYDVEIALLEPSVFGPPTPIASVREHGAILIEVADLSLEEGTGSYIQRRALDDRSATFDLPFRIGGTLLPDRLVMTVRDAAGDVVGRVDAVGAPSGTLTWDGRPPRSGMTVPAGLYEVTVEGFIGPRNVTGAVRRMITIFDFELDQIGTGGGFAILANTDDDDLDGTRDFEETSGGAVDDEIMGIRLTLDPPITGQLTLRASDPTKTRFYRSPDKGGGPLSAPDAVLDVSSDGVTEFWLDSTGIEYVDIALAPSDAAPMDLVRRPLNYVEIFAQNMGLGGRPGWVDFARMNDLMQYGPATSDFATNLPLRLTPDSDFIDMDSHHVQVFLYDRGRFDGTGTIPADLFLTVETRNGTGGIDDDPTRLRFERTDGQPELFSSMLIVPPDLPVNPDDDFPVPSGPLGPVMDDMPGDRTHRATVDGSLRLLYRRVTGESWAFTRPVCQRAPEMRRVVPLRLTVFRDPTTGAPLIPSSYSGDVAAFADEILDGANSVWAPACIRFFWERPPAVVPAPLDPDLPVPPPPARPLTIFDDGAYDAADWDKIVDAHGGEIRPDMFHIFAVPPIDGALGRAYLPVVIGSGIGLASSAVLGSDSPSILVLAHELGHMMTNLQDQPTPTFIRFPATPDLGGVRSPWLYSVEDDRVNEARRVTDEVISAARTDRSQAHAVPGDIRSAPPPADTPGNYALHLPGTP